MSTKSTSTSTASLDGPDGHRYLIPKDKEQAFEAWSAAVTHNDLETYRKNDGETFERYRIVDYAYNFAVVKSFYAQAAS